MDIPPDPPPPPQLEFQGLREGFLEGKTVHLRLGHRGPWYRSAPRTLTRLPWVGEQELALTCIKERPEEIELTGELPGGVSIRVLRDYTSQFALWVLSARHPDLPPGLVIGPQATGSWRKRIFAAEDLQVGAADFDDVVFIEADPSALSLRLGSASRAGLVALVGQLVRVDRDHKRSAGEVRDGAVHWTTSVYSGSELAFDRLEPLIEFITGVCVDLVATTAMDHHERLKELARHDPDPGVRRRILVRYLSDRLAWLGTDHVYAAQIIEVMKTLADLDADGDVAFAPGSEPMPPDLDPVDLTAALLLLLEEREEHREQIIGLLAEWGNESAVRPLLEIADAFFGDDEIKAGARAAVDSIAERQGGLRSGGLSLGDDDAQRGAVSLDSRTGAVTLVNPSDPEGDPT